LRRSERPSFCEKPVVNVFQPNSCDLPKDINSVQELLEIDQPHIPAIVARCDDSLKRCCRVSMATSCIKVHEIQRWCIRHERFVKLSPHCNRFGLQHRREAQKGLTLVDWLKERLS
jgi:hypothetical protein